MKTVAVPIEIQLTEKQLSVIANGVAGETPTAKKVQIVAQSVVKDLADGGVMLSPDAVKRIEDAIADVSPDSVVESVEASVKRKGQNIVLTLTIDPAWYPALKEASESQGRPVEDLMQECIAHAFHQGWLYAIPSDPPPLMVTRDDIDFLKKTIGVDQVFGADVVGFMRKLVTEIKEGKRAIV